MLPPLNDNDSDTDMGPTVYIVIGRVWREGETSPEAATTIHALLTAPDDDSAVRKVLESLEGQGFAEAELDQIGIIDEEPDDPVYDGAYQDALAGNVAIVTFQEG